MAVAFRHPEIDLPHLLVAAIRHEGSGLESILSQLGKSRAHLESIVEEFLKEQPSKSSVRENLTMSPAAQNALAQALEEKAKLYDALVEPEHIFIAAFDVRSKLPGVLRDRLGVTTEDIYQAIAEAKAVAQIATAGSTAPSSGDSDSGSKEVSGTLRYCEDLTNQAAAGQFDICVGRDKEIQQVIQILLRRRKNSPVLVGGAGVGKTAIVEGFAQAVVEEKVPRSLHGVKVMGVDMGSLVAGAKYKGEFEERFKALVGDVVKSGGRIVLFIDEIHTICGGGSTGGGMDAANLLKPALARGQIRLVGATTEEEYSKHLEKDKALDRRFERVKVEPPSPDEAIRIVRGVVPKYQEHHKITYTEDAIVGSVKFATRYLAERNLPDIALDIIDEAASEYAVKQEFGKDKIVALQAQAKEIEKQLAAFGGKEPDPESEEYGKLKTAVETFEATVNRLDELWGHRIDAAGAGV